MGTQDKIFTILQISFKSPFLVQRPKAKLKIKNFLEKYVFPQKFRGQVGWNFEDNTENVSRIAEKVPHQAPKKIYQSWFYEKFCFCSKFMWTRNVHFWQPCHLSRQRSNNCRWDSEINCMNNYFSQKKTIFVAKLLWAYKTLFWRPLRSKRKS